MRFITVKLKGKRLETVVKDLLAQNPKFIMVCGESNKGGSGGGRHQICNIVLDKGKATVTPVTRNPNRDKLEVTRPTRNMSEIVALIDDVIQASAVEHAKRPQYGARRLSYASRLRIGIDNVLVEGALKIPSNAPSMKEQREAARKKTLSELANGVQYTGFTVDTGRTNAVMMNAHTELKKVYALLKTRKVPGYY